MKVMTVIGLGFGDEGKGRMVDFLSRQSDAPAWNIKLGGCQAAHHVHTDGHAYGHCFRHFGSGTFSGAETFLSQNFFWNPISLIWEAKALVSKGVKTPLNLVYIDDRAPIVTPFHVAANRIRESACNHGSCGMGIGELARDMEKGYPILRAMHLAPSNMDFSESLESLCLLLSEIQERKRAELDVEGIDWESTLESLTNEAELLLDKKKVEEIASAYLEMSASFNLVDGEQGGFLKEMFEKSRRDIIFESSQGILLDEYYGFYPNNTWVNVTHEPAQSVLKEAGYLGPHEIIGVTRTYLTRHGAGPFPTEVEDFKTTHHEDNVLGKWQGKFRYGDLDLVLLHYAVDCVKKHMLENESMSIALTHLDRFQKHGPVRVCTAYHQKAGACITRLEVSPERRSITHSHALSCVLRDEKELSCFLVDLPTPLANTITEFTGVPVKYGCYGPKAGSTLLWTV